MDAENTLNTNEHNPQRRNKWLCFVHILSKANFVAFKQIKMIFGDLLLAAKMVCMCTPARSSSFQEEKYFYINLL